MIIHFMKWMILLCVNAGRRGGRTTTDCLLRATERLFDDEHTAGCDSSLMLQLLLLRRQRQRQQYLLRSH